MFIAMSLVVRRLEYHDNRTIPETYRRQFCPWERCIGLLLQPVLVFIHRICRAQSYSIGIYELVSDDDVPAQTRCCEEPGVRGLIDDKQVTVMFRRSSITRIVSE